MIYNITRPMALTSILNVPRKPSATEAGYESGKSAALKELEGLTPGEARRKIRSYRKELQDKKYGLDSTIGDLDTKLGVLKDKILAFTDLMGWGRDFLKLEKPEFGAFSSLRGAVNARTALDLHDSNGTTITGDYEAELFEDATPFLMEHDWFSAINKADEFSAGSFRLPFDICVFEFRISRKRVVAIAVNYSEMIGDTSAENEILMQIGVESLVGWTLSQNIYRHSGGAWETMDSGRNIEADHYRNLVRIVGNQIRAACIALDAEVATSEIVRSAHIGNIRNAALLPMFEYRTLSLAKKSRPGALASSGEKRGVKRLHFRRGHWRHFTTSKTWVRWTLVGNPELGFIEKNYRL